MRRALPIAVAVVLAVVLAACAGSDAGQPSPGEAATPEAGDADGGAGEGSGSEEPGGAGPGSERGRESGDEAIPVPGAGPRVVRDVPYVDDPAPNQRLDIHLPAGEGPHPVLVWVHGGGWVAGDRAEDDEVWETYADRYAVVSVGYRFAPAATWPAQGDDVLAALDLVQREAQEYGLDPDRVVVAGMSSGAHLAAWAGLQPEAGVEGILVFGGPTVLDDLSLAGDALGVGVVALLLGCFPVAAECEEVAADASPRTWARADAPPVLVQHGEDDPVVPVDVARAFEAALVEAGADPVTEYVPDLGHEYRLSAAVDDFLADALG